MTRPFPSIERLLVRELKNSLGAHFTSELPHDFQDDGVNAHLPLGVVDRIAGANFDDLIDRPVVDIDIYGRDRAQAQDLAELVRSYLVHVLPGRVVDYRDHRVVFTRTRVIVAPRLLPHANPAVRRYSANYELLLHTTP